MQEKCNNCKHFVRHYIIDRQFKIRKAYCGHCLANKNCKIKNDCKNYSEGEQDYFNEQYLCLADYFNMVNKNIQNLLAKLQKLALDFDLYIN